MIHSSQVECNANKTGDTEIENNAAKSANESGEETKTKSPTGRFANRNYRRRSDSQSSTNSVLMQEDTVSNPAVEVLPNGNKPQVNQCFL